MESTKKDKDGAIEIGGFYAIIGKDIREYKVEVLGKRVSELETVVYIHYDGTDKRLDEWVDVTRLTPLKDQKKVTTPVTVGGPGTPGSTATTGSPTSTTDASEAGGRPKRKAIKDEVAALLESMKRPTSRMRSGELGQDGSMSKPISPHGHDHDEEDVPQVRNVEWILYAGYDIATWYYSPYPDEYQDCQRLFICEYCLKYIRQVDSFINHTKTTCKRKRPPGTVVYSKGINKIYKVDGKTNKLYCQNLCLLAKLFLDNKTLYFDVPGFQFFVLTETRTGDRADVPVGFFSKEIVSYDGYNLACILVLPPFQRKSYGKLLIEFSYELTKIEGKVGSPEKPLSDLGKLGYVSYWITAILRELYPRPWPAKRPPPSSQPNRRRSRALSSASGTAAATATSADVVKIEEGSDATTSETDTSLVSIEKVKEEETDEKVDRLQTEAMDVDPSCLLTTTTDATSASTTKQSQAQDTLPQKDKEVAFSVRELAARTGIMEEDLLETLVTMGWMSHWQSISTTSTKTTTVPAAVRNAKRNYRKLKKFQEQQQLFEKLGGAQHHDQDGHGHHYHGHHGHGHGHGHGQGHGHDMDLSGNSGLFRLSHSSSMSSSVAAPTASLTGMFTGAVIGGDGSTPAHGPFSSLSELPLTHSFDPVSILEIPDSEDEATERDADVVEGISLSRGKVVEEGGSKETAETAALTARGVESGDETQQQQQGVRVKVESGIAGGVTSSSAPSASSALSQTTPSKHLTMLNTGEKDVVAVVTMEMVKEYQDRHNIRLDTYLDWNAIDWVAYRSTLEPPH
ncbi:K(lysine) acetyltransferase [Linnemannia gamsii]|uniref:histone acetyltransferase n=1 Tax=Linnemannia gamsii TaxID=64522 RepID=A0ABQ7JPJ7_9FUNG|nr:K(lysine) acetyltransferase [Linnemannia gamsii]